MSRNKQNGSLHVILLVGAIIALSGVLIYVLVNRNQTNSTNAQGVDTSTAADKTDNTGSATETGATNTQNADSTETVVQRKVQSIYDTYIAMAKNTDSSSAESIAAPGDYLKGYLSGKAADTSRLGETGPILGTCWVETISSISFSLATSTSKGYKLSGTAIGAKSGDSYAIDVYYDPATEKITDYTCTY